MSLALGVFALAAVGGLVMAVMRFAGKPAPPLALAAIHGLAAAGGLILLASAVLGSAGAGSGALVALVLLLAAAGGGFVLISQHLKRGTISIPLMVLHAALAVTGVVVLFLSR
jgi:hypothetical protein